ncbi:hypothetical protein QVD17_16949 [Tagetes erecta]|uniref:Pectinesterase inhibitor domain-containing protein n=1 Tax=Tagetes erecta TaxID=13708 RepID=A0AAD8KVW9_TARER|nr:hypothetical protein QVD17_16949 [Tagetes erecta]
MKFYNHILLIISVVSLFFIVLAKGTDNSPSSSKEEEIYDEVKQAFGPAFNNAKEKFGPISSLDFEQYEEAKDAFGPIPSFDEAKEALGPAASPILEKAREALGPISPAAIEDAKEALGPASSKAKETLGPASASVIDKAREKLDSITSWITQNKEETSLEGKGTLPPSEAPSPIVSPFDPYGLLDGAKENFNSLLDSITKEKEQISSSLSDDAQKKSGPVSSIDIDKAKENEARKSLSPISNVITPSPASSSSPEGSDLSKALDEAKEKSESPSNLTKSRKELRDDDPSGSSTVSAPAPAPILPSTFKEAMDVAKEKFSSLTSYLSQNKVQISAEPETKPRSNSAFFDHDSALAIESMIKQAQSNSQLAIDEAKTLLSDPIDSSDSGNCVQKCMTSYESCSQKLKRAMEDLKARNVELLKTDIGAVEGEINVCQKCFQENTKTQSPFSDLEEATIKATRECLNVLDHSG